MLLEILERLARLLVHDRCDRLRPVFQFERDIWLAVLHVRIRLGGACYDITRSEKFDQA